MFFCQNLYLFVLITLIQKFYETTDHVMLCYVYTTRKLTVEDPKRSQMGSLKSQCATSYRSLIETIALDCLVFFEKIAFFAFWRQTNRLTDKQTDKQMDSSDALGRFRYRERRPNSRKWGLHESRTAYTATKSK